MPCPTGYYQSGTVTYGSGCGYTACNTSTSKYLNRTWVSYTCVNTSNGAVSSVTDYTDSTTCCTR